MKSQGSEREPNRMLKIDVKSIDDRLPPSSSILSPPNSPLGERREILHSPDGAETHLGSKTSLVSEKSASRNNKHRQVLSRAEPEANQNASSPINIPISKAKSAEVTSGLEMSSLKSLSQMPASKYIVGRSHYSNQPITLEYYITEKIVEAEDGSSSGGKKMMKQATTIRSIGDYQVVRTIGSGSTGKVKLGINIRSQQKVAIKIISRKYISDPLKKSKESPASRKRRILREAAILNLVHHPNIVQLHDLYVTDEYYCMVFEYVDGGQMLDYIISHGKLKELQAKKFFLQLLSAVSYCHRNGIVHRDLKIENVLIDGEGNVKLVDFGLSNFYNPLEKLKTFCGSLYFAAPELLKGIQYTGPEVDIWSLGIILYVLVCGKVPFDDKSLTVLHEKIKSGRFNLLPHLSPECQNLLKVMIEVDPLKRARMTEILNHPWIKTEGGGVMDYTISRDPLNTIDLDIEAFLFREFPYQFEVDEIKDTLRSACLDWSETMNLHPIISLYYLASQKQQRQLKTPSITANKPTTAIFPISSSESRVSEAIERVHPHSLGAMPMRKRADSLPEGGGTKNNEKDDRRAVRKSRRSASLKQEPPESAMEFKAKEEPTLFPISEEDIPVRTVYLRGIFSVNTTSTKNPRELRSIIMTCLRENHPSIIYLDRESYFICEYQASLSRGNLLTTEDDCEQTTPNDDVDISQVNLATEELQKCDMTLGSAPLRSMRFEIHIVKVALLGLHGIQFKRISGDFEVYRNLCSQLISELNL